MAEELGKIEKPSADQYKTGRKLFFVPLLYGDEQLEGEYKEKVEKYWKQVTDQLADLSRKLGTVKHIYHELVGTAGDTGVRNIEEINASSFKLIDRYLKSGAAMEAVEDADILSEFMDWSRCIYIGLQNPRVIEQVYKAYTEASQKRTEAIASNLDKSLNADEIGILIMSENHHVQFPLDIQVFYVAPPALDEIKRWMREQEASANKESETKSG